MKVWISNRLENLIDALADQLRENPLDPLSPETLLVQSFGMSRWISLEMAKRHGVFAGARFVFPNRFLDDVFSAFILEFKPDTSYDVDVITWTLIRCLPEMMDQPGFESVYKYLHEDENGLKRYQLASRIAQTFDQYLIFRPDRILAWEKGEPTKGHEAWQAELWRRLRREQGAGHSASLREEFSRAVQRPPVRPECLPKRLTIFGISYLPPYHLDILNALSGHLPIDFYYLSPSSEFWADIRSQKEITKTLARSKRGDTIADDHLLHLESANGLLAAWGTLGRQFFNRLTALDIETMDCFARPHQNSLLSCVQSDIYHLHEPASDLEAPVTIGDDDDSISVHDCHSPLRVVETLHDLILGMFDKDPTFTPGDILVMTPDIDLYAPYIEAVFASRTPRIPYTIADRKRSLDKPVRKAIMDMLNLADSRFTVSDVLTVLENQAVSERFGMAKSDLALIRHWLAQTRVRWGIDENHRAQFDLPANYQNTWRHGWDRMIAGIALDGRRQELFEGILPYGEIESEPTELLGRFGAFWQRLTDLQAVLCRDHTLKGWSDVLKTLLTDFFSSNDDHRDEMLDLRDLFSRMPQEQDMALSRAVIRQYLTSLFTKESPRSRFLSKGVSFGALVPMRSIPFPVIALMGMHQQAFPRREVKTGFSLMDDAPRPGDRSIRLDDFYLFLEALLSARGKLVILYQGQDLQGQNEHLPSIVVSDLLDYLDRNYVTESGGLPVSKRITVRHHRHAFHYAYFKADASVPGYSKAQAMAASALARARAEEPNFLNGCPLDPVLREGSLLMSDVMDCFRSPARYFLKNRLGIRLDALNEPEDETEPFAIHGLDAYEIKQGLVRCFLSGEDDRPFKEFKKAQGAVPVGVAGTFMLEGLEEECRQFANRLKDVIRDQPLKRTTFRVGVGEDILTGEMEYINHASVIHYRMAKAKPQDFLGAWGRHLMAQLADVPECSKTTVLLTSDGSWCFEPLGDAEQILARWLDHYKRGMDFPVPFFPKASVAYAKRLWVESKKSPNRDDAMTEAEKAWFGDDWTKGECEEPEYVICYGRQNPLDAAFEDVTRDILMPLFTHMKKMD